MQIVIDIPEGFYEYTKTVCASDTRSDYLYHLVANGIPLPEHHGDLKDADDIGLTDFEIISCDGDYKQALKLICKKIDEAPTIIKRRDADANRN